MLICLIHAASFEVLCDNWKGISSDDKYALILIIKSTVTFSIQVDHSFETSRQ